MMGRLRMLPKIGILRRNDTAIGKNPLKIDESSGQVINNQRKKPIK